MSFGRAPLVGGGPRNAVWFREDFGALLDLLRADKIHPIVAERVPLSDARRAHELLGSFAAKGKLVLVREGAVTRAHGDQPSRVWSTSL